MFSLFFLLCCAAAGLRGQKDQSTYEWVLKQHRDQKTGEIDEQHWEIQGKKGSFYMSPAPKLPSTKFTEVELGRVLEERHNRVHDPKDRIHIFSGGTPEDAYARASWVERDEEAQRKKANSLFGGSTPVKEVDGDEDEDEESKDERKVAIVDARGSPAKPNGWKLARRAGNLGFVDDNTQWAKNKVTRPFIVPPTEDEIHMSSDEEEGEDSRFFAM